MREKISCSVCKRSAVVGMRSYAGFEWYAVPDGWLVSDTYPPGDEGLQFWCSECQAELSIQEVHEI